MSTIKPDYLRVTEIISAFSGIDQIDPTILNRAADRGSEVHGYIQGFFNGWEFEVVSPECTPYCNSFHKFWAANKHLFESGTFEIEKRLYCNELKITGQIDLIVKTPVRTYALDWKTSSREQKSWKLQGAAYKYLLMKNGYENVDDLLFVHLQKDKKAISRKYSDYEYNMEIFMKCYIAYGYMQEIDQFFKGKKKEKIEEPKVISINQIQEEKNERVTGPQRPGETSAD